MLPARCAHSVDSHRRRRRTRMRRVAYTTLHRLHHRTPSCVALARIGMSAQHQQQAAPQRWWPKQRKNRRQKQHNQIQTQSSTTLPYTNDAIQPFQSNPWQPPSLSFRHHPIAHQVQSQQFQRYQHLLNASAARPSSAQYQYTPVGLSSPSVSSPAPVVTPAGHPHPHAAAGRSNSSKRRKLPNFLGNQPEDEDDTFRSNQIIPATMPMMTRVPSAPMMMHHSHPYTTNAFQRSYSTPQQQQQQQPASSSSSTYLHPPPKVELLPGLPKATLPPQFEVHYISTREQSEYHASQLLAFLRTELDYRAAPSTSQHQAHSGPCECPSGPLVLGFDLEWRPSFIKGQPQNPVALLQLSTDKFAYLFQIVRWAKPRPIRPDQFPNIESYRAAQHAEAVHALGSSLSTILLDPRILKVGIGIKADITKFNTDYGLQVQGMLDLSDYANQRLYETSASSSVAAAAAATADPVLVPPRTWGLAALVTETMSVELAKPKKVRMSNWELSLTPHQQQYAALDAYVSVAIFQRLHATHLRQSNCARALAFGKGVLKMPQPKKDLQPIQVTVRPASPSTASATSSTPIKQQQHARPKRARSSSSFIVIDE